MVGIFLAPDVKFRPVEAVANQIERRQNKQANNSDSHDQHQRAANPENPSALREG
jgi:hypothetical protein